MGNRTPEPGGERQAGVRFRRGAGAGQVVDRRGQRGGGTGFGGLPMGGSIGGIGGIILILVLLFFGGRSLLGGDGGTATAPPVNEQGSDVCEAGFADDDQACFIQAVVGDVQAFWATTLPAQTGTPYQETDLVLFEEATSSGCGPASSSTGPFYCPLDRMVYIDLGFFNELFNRLGASGDFAQAYVVAHEFGHHVQTVLGTTDAINTQQQQDPSSANDVSVRFELQADCLAGVWANSAQEDLEPGDLQEAVDAAAAVGDDRIQETTQGRVDPESFTHGTSEQRMRWLQTGYDQASVAACDTFAAQTV